MPGIRGEGAEEQPIYAVELTSMMVSAMRSWAARYVADDDADDVVQEAGLRYCRRRKALIASGRIQSEGHLRVELLRLVRSVAAELQRKEGRRRRREQKLAAGTSPDRGSADPSVLISGMRRWEVPGAIAERAEIDPMVARHVNALSGRMREVFLLASIGEMTADQIGNALGISSGSVRSTLAKATSRLRERLQRSGFAPASAQGYRRSATVDDDEEVI